VSDARPFPSWLRAQKGREDDVGEVARRLTKTEGGRIASRSIEQILAELEDRGWSRATLRYLATAHAEWTHSVNLARETDVCVSLHENDRYATMGEAVRAFHRTEALAAASLGKRSATAKTKGS
jgi:hypothetical protein